MADHFSGADSAHDKAVVERTALGLTAQEACGEQIARAGCIHDLCDGFGGNARMFAPRMRFGSVRAMGDDERGDFGG